MRLRFTALLIVAVAGCESITDQPATITGVIVAVDTRTSGFGPPTIHVKESINDPCGIVFSVRSARIVWPERSSLGQPVNRETALIVGRHVEVWSQLVLESCPGQSGAEAIRVVE